MLPGLGGTYRRYMPIPAGYVLPGCPALRSCLQLYSRFSYPPPKFKYLQLMYSRTLSFLPPPSCSSSPSLPLIRSHLHSCFSDLPSSTSEIVTLGIRSSTTRVVSLLSIYCREVQRPLLSQGYSTLFCGSSIPASVHRTSTTAPDRRAHRVSVS